MAKPCQSSMARRFAYASNGKSDTRTPNSSRGSKPSTALTLSAAVRAVSGKTEATNGTQDYESHVPLRSLTRFCSSGHLCPDASGKKPVAGRGAFGKHEARRVALFERRSAQHALFAARSDRQKQFQEPEGRVALESGDSSRTFLAWRYGAKQWRSRACDVSQRSHSHHGGRRIV